MSCKVPLCASVDLLTDLQELIFAKWTPENELLFSPVLYGREEPLPPILICYNKE